MFIIWPTPCPIFEMLSASFSLACTLLLLDKIIQVTTIVRKPKQKLVDKDIAVISLSLMTFNNHDEMSLTQHSYISCILYLMFYLEKINY